jgi:hypothetical protein
MRYVCMVPIGYLAGCFNRDLSNRGKVFGEIDIYDTRFQLRPYEGFDLFIQEWVEHFLMPFWRKEEGYRPELAFIKSDDTSVVMQDELANDQGLDRPSMQENGAKVYFNARLRMFSLVTGLEGIRARIYLPLAPDWSTEAIYTFTWFRMNDSELDFETAMSIIKDSQIDRMVGDQLVESQIQALRFLWASVMKDSVEHVNSIILMRCDVIHCTNCQDTQKRKFVAQTSVETRLIPISNTS